MSQTSLLKLGIPGLVFVHFDMIFFLESGLIFIFAHAMYGVVRGLLICSQPVIGWLDEFQKFLSANSGTCTVGTEQIPYVSAFVLRAPVPGDKHLEPGKAA